MKPDQYIPSEEEMRRAESMMTDEQREASRIREKHYEQEQPPWEPFDDQHLDRNFKRIPPTPEQTQEMDRRLNELSRLFEGSKLRWHIDGAINISAMRGDYIGYHKDVDISIEKEDLPALEGWLEKKGYAFFLSRIEERTGKKILRRVSPQDSQESDTAYLIIAAIDPDGKIRQGPSLNFFDFHVLKRNGEGQALGRSDVVVPEKWAQSSPTEFHEMTIPLSHPGKVVYYKIHQGRNYDLTDLQQLVEAGNVTSDDLDDVAAVFEAEFLANIERGRRVFERVAPRLRPNMNPDEIYTVLLTIPEFEKAVAPMEELFREFAKKIAESNDTSPESLVKVATEVFNVEEKNNQKRKEIERLRLILSDKEKTAQVRSELQG